MTSQTARADGPHPTYGVSSRTKGMGNAQAASAAGWEAAYTNPAGLSFLKKGEFSIGASFVVPDLHIELDEELGEESLNQPRTNRSPHTSTTWGLAFPFQGIVKDRLFFGFALNLPTRLATHATTPDPATPFFYRYDTYDEHYDVALALSIRWLDFLSTGVGVRIGGGQVGTLDINADALRQRYTYQSLNAFQFSIYSPTVGVIVGPLGLDGIAVFKAGLTYRDKVSTPMNLPANIRLDGLDVQFLVPIIGETNFSPRTFSGGISTEILDAITLSLDVDYRLWSQTPPPFIQTSVTIFGDDVDAIGLDDGFDIPAVGQNRVVNVGFVDTWAVRVGGEVRPLGDVLALRAGYGYRPTPVPDQVSGTNIVDATAHVISAGAGLTLQFPFFAEPLRMDAAWQSQILQVRSAVKDRADDDIGAWTAYGAVHEMSASATYFF